MRLLPPGAHAGEWIGSLCVPDDLYWVTRAPVALAGMSYPGRADWSLLHAQGIGHVVCLTHDRAPYDPGPCTITSLRLQDLVDGRAPHDHEHERTLVVAAVDDVCAQLARGIGVAVHCLGGRGRTGTVIGAVLVRNGHAPDDVIDYLRRVAQQRGRRTWPESEWQANLLRNLA
jgi:hypothetical protein